MPRDESPSLTDKLAGLVDKLLRSFGHASQPAPALVPAVVRRPQPTRIPVSRR